MKQITPTLNLSNTRYNTNEKDEDVMIILHTCMFQSCSTVCNPMDYSQPGSSIHGIFQARILEYKITSCHFLLQGIFLTQGSNPHLLICRQSFYC